MSRLHDTGHPEARDIYSNEIKKRDELYNKFLNNKRARQDFQKGTWNEFFGFGISSKKLQALENQMSRWIEFPTDSEYSTGFVDSQLYKAWGVIMGLFESFGTDHITGESIPNAAFDKSDKSAIFIPHHMDRNNKMSKVISNTKLNIKTQRIKGLYITCGMMCLPASLFRRSWTH